MDGAVHTVTDTGEGREVRTGRVMEGKRRDTGHGRIDNTIVKVDERTHRSSTDSRLLGFSFSFSFALLSNSPFNLRINISK